MEVIEHDMMRYEQRAGASLVFCKVSLQCVMLKICILFRFTLLQNYFNSYETCQSVDGEQTREHRQNHLTHPQDRFRLFRM